MAEALQTVKAILLLAIAIVKSTLVIWFYMHLKDEKPILAVVLLLPLLIAALSVHVPAGAPARRITPSKRRSKPCRLIFVCARACKRP